MEEGASPPRWALDKKLGEDASMEEKKEGEKEIVGNWINVTFEYATVKKCLLLAIYNLFLEKH